MSKDAAFAEQHLGERQGMNGAAFRASRPAGTSWLADVNEPAPGGESFMDGSVSTGASEYGPALRYSRYSVMRLPGWPGRSQRGEGTVICSAWRERVGCDGIEDGDGCALRHTRDRTEPPIWGTRSRASAGTGVSGRAVVLFQSVVSVSAGTMAHPLAELCPDRPRIAVEAIGRDPLGCDAGNHLR
jgi:hypothetical protein